MSTSNCLVFPDGADWIVYAPVSRLAFRTNETAARRFRRFVDTGSPNGIHLRPVSTGSSDSRFAPTHATIITSNMCGQACVYCYGTPAHENRSLLDPDFCRAALEFMASGAARSGQCLRVFFHGVGEPTYAWPLFQKCVEIALRITETSGIRTLLRLCTGGQVTAARADWIADRFNQVDVSLDGPRDIQNHQRPRRDGSDSFDGPLRLARAVVARHKKLIIKTTVTRFTADRISEIVQFVARDIGSAHLHLSMMFPASQADNQMFGPPPWEDYVREFGKAMDLGARLGVKVSHPHIAYESLCFSNPANLCAPFCLAPPRTVTSFFDVPVEGADASALGAYGYYDPAKRAICFDHEKRRQLEQAQPWAVCQICPCGPACIGTGGVRGRVPKAAPLLGRECQARLGVLRELVRRSVPRQIVKKEAIP